MAASFQVTRKVNGVKFLFTSLENVKFVPRCASRLLGSSSARFLLHHVLEVGRKGGHEKNSIRDACSIADCCLLLTIRAAGFVVALQPGCEEMERELDVVQLCETLMIRLSH